MIWCRTKYPIGVSGVLPNRIVTKKGHPCGYPFFLGDPAGIRTLNRLPRFPWTFYGIGVSGVLNHPNYQNKKAALRLLLRFGDPAGIRTPDTLLKRQVLCRLSYWIKLAGLAGFEPADARVKVWCLTAWRQPNVSPPYGEIKGKRGPRFLGPRYQWGG